MSARLVELIESTAIRGNDEGLGPYRAVTEWWTTEGKLVVEDDPYDRYREMLEERVEKMGPMEELCDEAVKWRKTPGKGLGRNTEQLVKAIDEYQKATKEAK